MERAEATARFPSWPEAQFASWKREAISAMLFL
jgi:hypothetical protein